MENRETKHADGQSLSLINSLESVGAKIPLLGKIHCVRVTCHLFISPSLASTTSQKLISLETQAKESQVCPCHSLAILGFEGKSILRSASYGE